MARPARMALDLALVSVKRVRPVISKLWNSAKSTIGTTPVRPLLCNPIVTKIEDVLDGITDTIITKITILRDQQLEGELKYLEKELENVKKKIGRGGHTSISKTLRAMFTTAWQYAKVEIAPPMTVGYFQGPGGQKLEEAVSKVCDGFISGIEGRIKEIDLAEARAIKEKEAAIQAEQEKLKAEAKKKEQEKKRKEAENEAKEAKKSEAKAEKAKETPPKKEEKKKDAKKK